MLEAARRYCRTVADGLPRNFEFDDLVQEYVTAELEGRDGAKAVQEYVNSVDKHTKNTVSFQSMGFVPDEEIDLDMSETEQDEYQRIEQEIFNELRQISRSSLELLLVKLDRAQPDHSATIRFIASCGLEDGIGDVDIARAENESEIDKELVKEKIHGTIKAIMNRFNKSFVASRYMWIEGIKALREYHNPTRLEDRPLWGEEEYVPDVRKPHTKWKRAVRPMTDVILGEDAA